MRAILTYHSIDRSGSAISLDERAFRRQVEWMVGSGIRVVALDRLPSLPASDHAVALTFDDGFANFAVHAWPVLRDHGLPVTLFVVSDRVGGTNSWDAGSPTTPALPLLGWEQLGILQAEGVTLGAHTRTHPDLRTVSQARLEDEVQSGAGRLEAETGRGPTAFAYPYGAFDDRVVAAVRGTYQVACTTEYRLLSEGDDRHRLPRLDAFYFRDPRRMESWGSTSFRRRVWMRGRARSARKVLTRIGMLR